MVSKDDIKHHLTRSYPTLGFYIDLWCSKLSSEYMDLLNKQYTDADKALETAKSDFLSLMKGLKGS